MKLLNKITISIFLVSYLFLSGCSSNNTAGGQVNPNTVGTPFTVKYELLTTSQFADVGLQLIQYSNSTGQNENIQTNLAGLNYWSKSINVTASQRPLPLLFNCDVFVYITTPGSVTINMYINGSLKASSTYQAVPNQMPGSTNYYVIPSTLLYQVS